METKGRAFKELTTGHHTTISWPQFSHLSQLYLLQCQSEFSFPLYVLPITSQILLILIYSFSQWNTRSLWMAFLLLLWPVPSACPQLLSKTVMYSTFTEPLAISNSVILESNELPFCPSYFCYILFSSTICSTKQ